MTVKLHVLGAIRLTRDGNVLEDVLSQPKRLALLTYLALARPRGFRSRDELLLMFWPDSTEQKARTSLRSALHFLRQSLGRDAIVSRGSNEIDLAPDAVQSDAMAFEAAVEEGRLEEAMALYEGPLLGNARIEISPEWETWLESERDRLAGLAREATWSLATRAAARGDAAGAERWGLAAVEHAPEDEQAARRLMELLEESGRRPAALAVYGRLRAALEDLGYEPEVATVELAERIRAAPRRAVESANQPVAPAPEEPAERPPAERATPVPGPEREPSAPTRRWAVLATLAVATVALVLAGTILLTRNDGAATEGLGRRPGLAVFPFVVRGTDDSYGLGDGIVDLLSASLDGFEAWRTIDPRAVYGVVGERPSPIDPRAGASLADHLDARYYVLGSVVGEGRRLRVTAGLYDREAGTEPVATTTIEGNQDELFRLADRLAAELAIQRAVESPSLDHAAAPTTESLIALRLYLSGTRSLREGDFGRAVEQLRMAIEADTTFALAAYRLRLAADAAGADPGILQMADRLMARHLDRLPERVRRLAGAHMTLVAEGPFAAEAVYRDILEEYPEDVEARYQLGDILFHYHPLRGESFATSRDAFERVLEFEPDHLDAIVHLARIAAWRRDLPRLEDLTRRGLGISGEGDLRLELLALRGVVLDDAEALESVLDELEHSRDGWVWIVATRTAVFSGNPEKSSPLFAPLLAETRPSDARGMAHVAFAHLALARGRPAEADRELDLAEEIQAGIANPFRPWLATWPFLTGRCEADAPFAPPSTAAVTGHPAQELATMVAARRGPIAHPPPEPLVEALLDACHGRFTPALAAAARIEAGLENGPLLAASIRRHVAWAGGPRPSGEVLEAPTGPSIHSPQARSAWILGELHRREGRLEDALGWYRATVRDLEIGSVAYYGPAELRRAEVLERLGRTEEARLRYRRFVELWDGAEPELRPLVVGARERLSELGD